MAKIRNMGTATMRFGEGIIVSGSAGNDVHSLVTTGSIVSTTTITGLTGSFQVVDLDRLSLTSNQTTVPPLQLTANSLQDGVGALRIDGSQADIFLNPSTATHTTVTFAVNNDQRLAFGMDNNSDFYITRRTGGSWYDDTLVIDRNNGQVSLGYDLSVTGDIIVADEKTIGTSNDSNFVRFSENSTTYSGTDLSIGSNQSVHVLLDMNADGATTGGFTVRTGATTIDGASEVFKVDGAGSVTATSFTGSISTTEVSNASGDLTLSASPNSSDVYIKSSDRIYLELDNDTDSTSYLHIRSNTSTKFLFSEEGKLRIGDSIAPTNALQVVHDGSDSSDGIMIIRNDTSVVTDNLLGGIGFDSRDGNTPSSILEASAYIAAYAAETQSSLDKGGYLTFGTSLIDDNDDTTSTEHMRIESEGVIQASGMPGYILAYRSWSNVNNENSTITTGGEDFIEGATNGKANITFTAPPTGNVEIVFSAYIDQAVGGANLLMSLSQNGTTYTREAGTYFRVFDGDETDDGLITVRWNLTGLTAGVSYTYYFGGYSTTTNGIILRWGVGDPPVLGYPPLIMKAITMPALS